MKLTKPTWFARQVMKEMAREQYTGLATGIFRHNLNRKIERRENVEK